MGWKEHKMLGNDLIKQRDRFRLDREAPPTKDLSLREKQEVIHNILEGKIGELVKCYEQTEPDGTILHIVVQGWPELCALFDFIDKKFPPWTEAEKKEYYERTRQAD